MNWGLTACVLIRLEARQGQWVGVDDLAEHLSAAPPLVRQEIERLWSQDQLTVQRDVVSGEVTHAQARFDGVQP